MTPFEFKSGDVPLMLSIPHGGVWMPNAIADRMTKAGTAIKDTDWFLSRLYDFDELADASVIASNVSRYVVDLNRSSDNKNLYPGQNTTGLCPHITFAGEPLYADAVPDESEVVSRVTEWWQPYHGQLRAELDRLVGKFGFAVLLDGHSIASEVPRLFDGRLPDFNFGTNRGKTCGESLQKAVDTFASQLEQYSSVVNGRFVGGYITRHYGSLENVYAVQLELSQITYMHEVDLQWDEAGAAQVQPVICKFVGVLRDWIKQHEKV